MARKERGSNANVTVSRPRLTVVATVFVTSGLPASDWHSAVL